MENITKAQFDTTLDTFYLYKVTSVKPDGDSSESKQVTLKVKYDNVTINQLAQATLSQGVVVKWQNGGSGRKNYHNISNNDTVEVDFKAPGSMPQVDPAVQLVNEAIAAGIDVTDTDALAQYMVKRVLG